TGGAGWRMLSAPMSGVTPEDLADVSLVQGISGLPFSGASPNLYQWPGGTDANTNWQTPSDTDDLTGSGAPSGAAGGFVWYVFDAAETEFTDTPPFTLSLPGPSRTIDITTGSLSGTSTNNSAFHLLGNPYGQSFDISALNLSGQGFQTTVQVWDPSVGSYDQVMQSSTSADFIGPYQGFFVERANDNSKMLTVSASGRRADPIDLKTMEDAPPRIEFRLVGRDGDGAELTRDEAITLHAPEGATANWDVHDASKLTPLSGRYATAAFRGSLNGGTRLQSVMSVPSALPDGGIEVPVSLQLQGTDPVETFRFSWPTWTNVPDHWGLALHDTVADTTVNLRTQSGYTFTLPSSKAQSVPPPRSPMELPDQIRAKAQSDSARFTLTVQPSRIPVELTDFGATVSGETAQLTWTTASETNNAGFHVEHRGPESDGFASMGFVEGHGTTDRPQQYRFRTEPLDPGRHVFRLRQVDVDGTASRSDTVAVQVRLGTSASIEVAPNPVRTRTTVSLRVRTEQEVNVALYDVLGRRVRTLYDASLTPGRRHTLRINVGDLSSGLYLLRADGEQFQRTRRVTVVR
ncbi:MAG: T9SS type A sorting domain-containing protein, partial [Salinibacter sp.]